MNQQSESPLRVLLVDDHAFVREAIAALIGLEADLQVVAQVGTRTSALQANEDYQPDVILLDFQLVHGASTNIMAKLIQAAHAPKVLVLSSFAAQANVFASLDAGASGYLLKSSPAEQVLDAIRTVARGGRAFAQELQVSVRRPDTGDPRSAMDANNALTKREIEVLERIALGMSNEGIAQAMKLSLGTVKTHVHNTLEKLGVHNRTEAAACARARGIIAG